MWVTGVWPVAVSIEPVKKHHVNDLCTLSKDNLTLAPESAYSAKNLVHIGSFKKINYTVSVS